VQRANGGTGFPLADVLNARLSLRICTSSHSSCHHPTVARDFQEKYPICAGIRPDVQHCRSVRCRFAFLGDASRLCPLLHHHPLAHFFRTYQRQVCILALPARSIHRTVPLAGRGLDGYVSRAARDVPHLIFDTIKTSADILILVSIDVPS
jgi:hypothetical protein